MRVHVGLSPLPVSVVLSACGGHDRDRRRPAVSSPGNTNGNGNSNVDRNSIRERD